MIGKPRMEFLPFPAGKITKKNQQDSNKKPPADEIGFKSVIRRKSNSLNSLNSPKIVNSPSYFTMSFMVSTLPSRLVTDTKYMPLFQLAVLMLTSF